MKFKNFLHYEFKVLNYPIFITTILSLFFIFFTQSYLPGILLLFLNIISLFLHEFLHFFFAKYFHFKEIKINRKKNFFGISYFVDMDIKNRYFKILITSIFPSVANLIFAIFLIVVCFYFNFLLIIPAFINILFFISAIIAKDDFKILGKNYINV